MYFYNRIAIILISIFGILCGLALVSLWYPIPYITEFISNNMIDQLWFRNVILVFLLIILCLFVLLLLFGIFAPRSARYVTMDRDKGKLKVSKRAIESTAKNSISDLVPQNDISFKTKLRRNSNKVRMVAKLAMENKENALNVGQTAQNRINQALINVAEMDAVDLKVKIVEPSKKNNKKRNLI